MAIGGLCQKRPQIHSYSASKLLIHQQHSRGRLFTSVLGPRIRGIASAFDGLASEQDRELGAWSCEL